MAEKRNTNTASWPSLPIEYPDGAGDDGPAGLPREMSRKRAPRRVSRLKNLIGPSAEGHVWYDARETSAFEEFR